MSDSSIRVLVWFAVVAHLTFGVLSWRRGSALPLLPLINLAVAGCVVAYSMVRWYGVIARGIIWHASDQLLPLYALVVCIFSGLALGGKVVAAPVHWVIFCVQSLVLIAAALFFTFVKITRMI